MRITGWERRLRELISGRKREPFAWGSNDCCGFANAAVQAITGHDVMADVRPYTNEAGAARALVEAGVGSFEELVDRLLPAIHASMAQRGDLALAMQGNEAFLAVVEGDWLIGPGDDGLKFIPRDAAIKAWRVG